MKDNRSLEPLYQYASAHRFGEFDRLFSELRHTLPPDALWEAYLMRAQIKLYAADISALEDLEQAGKIDGQPQFSLLGAHWKVDAPNRFIVFPRQPGALEQFVACLPAIREWLERWYGPQGSALVRQVQCEAHYYRGEVQAALKLAEEPEPAEWVSYGDAMLAACMRFRCYLALEQPQKAEQCMLDIIRLSRSHPECVAAYQSFRGWASITTSWNGDSPRFCAGSCGENLPVLDDRLDYIRYGSSQTTPLEKPFVDYAGQSYGDAYALRHCYMDSLHAMYWWSAGDYGQMAAYFDRLYQVAQASGVSMPLVEYGEQITPLLQYIKDSGFDCSHQWIDDVTARARQYEKCLNRYRDSDI
ncbi:hypothetical protein LJC63_11570 [Ruminococcaceae bacterium OttesenSCG-928-L11]|nr:hypothetical protein [Ruminococcaceae bacterium OttesenSCG-928-L11]